MPSEARHNSEPGAFTDLQVIERDPGRGEPEWELTAPMTFVSSSGHAYTAPLGMRTNFASVPWFLRWVVPRTGRHNKAAVIHHHLWREADAGRTDRWVADDVFRDALCHLDVSWLRRWMMWTAVRQAGLAKPNRGRWPVRDVVAVLAITILAAPIVVPTTISVVGGRLAIWLVDLVVSLARRQQVPVTDEI